MNIKIPFGNPIFNKKTYSLVNYVLRSKKLVHGPMIEDFEKKFSTLTGANFSLGVSSCTTGMHMVYYHLGLKKGDEVIVPAQTHVATAMSVEVTGAKPIFVDSDPSTGNIDVEQIEKKITKKTKVLTIVHYLGLPVEMSNILKLAKKYKLFVLEDCALSLGSKYNNIHTGLLGDVGVFSFYPVKHITTSEGGMIITKHKKLYESLKLIRAFGVDKDYNKRSTPGEYNVIYKGINGRMSEIEAAIGVNQLEMINNFFLKRKKNFLELRNQLSSLKSISFQEPNMKMPFNWSYYCFAFILKKKIKKFRKEIIDQLNAKGIGTSIYYPHPVPYMNFFKKKYRLKNRFKNAEIFSYQTIMLPIGQHVTSKNISYISNAVIKILKKYEND